MTNSSIKIRSEELGGIGRKIENILLQLAYVFKYLLVFTSFFRQII